MTIMIIIAVIMAIIVDTSYMEKKMYVMYGKHDCLYLEHIPILSNYTEACDFRMTDICKT
jgi:hypothetical protein